MSIGHSKIIWQCSDTTWWQTFPSSAIWWPIFKLMQVVPSGTWPICQLMQVAPSGGQFCNSCKWRHLVANFKTNASGAIWWPFLQLMQVAPKFLAGEITQVYTLYPGSVVPLAMFYDINGGSSKATCVFIECGQERFHLIFGFFQAAWPFHMVKTLVAFLLAPPLASKAPQRFPLAPVDLHLLLQDVIGHDVPLLGG